MVSSCALLLHRLCGNIRYSIVKDDPDDWQKEAGQMAMIFHYCAVCLAATDGADDSDDMFFNVQKDLRYTGYRRVQALPTDVKSTALWVWDDSKSRDPRFGFLRNKGRYADSFFTRAWIFQEILLSPRVLHFFRGKMLLECMVTVMSRPSLTDRMVLLKQEHTSALSSGDRRSIAPRWQQMVTIYSTLHLTMEKDILPAIAGAASQIAKYRPGDPYLAGLWRTTLLEDLTWRPVPPHDIDEFDKFIKPAEWRAPSWSWASVKGRVRFPCDVAGHVFLPVSEVVKANCIGKSTTDFGKISAAALTIRGPLKLFQHDSINTYNWKPQLQDPFVLDPNDQDFRQLSEQFYLLILGELRTRAPAESLQEELRWLKAGLLNPPYSLLLELGAETIGIATLCLVLQKVGSDRFERIGLAQIFTAIGEPFPRESVAEVTFV